MLGAIWQPVKAPSRTVDQIPQMAFSRIAHQLAHDEATLDGIPCPSSDRVT